MDFSDVRVVFPSWPSELDVAVTPANWALMAQAFHIAAHILAEEQQEGLRRLHENVGRPVDVDALRRTMVAPAAAFCLAFSLELAIKAARVQQGALRNLKPGGRLPFQSHDLVALAAKVDGLGLSADDIHCLMECSVIVAAGKYPVGVKPDGSVNGVRPQKSFDDLARSADGLYGRLMDLASRDAGATG